MLEIKILVKIKDICVNIIVRRYKNSHNILFITESKIKSKITNIIIRLILYLIIVIVKIILLRLRLTLS